MKSPQNPEDYIYLEVIRLYSEYILTSKLLKFRKTTVDDLEYVLATEQDHENKSYITAWTKTQHMAALDHADCLHMTIEDQERSPVGFVIIFGLENKSRNIELMRIVISEKGKGYGTASLMMIQDFVFRHLKAHRLWLDVKEHNVRARHIYKKLGFQYQEKLNEFVEKEDSDDSLVVMSMLEEEYVKSKYMPTESPRF